MKRYFYEFILLADARPTFIEKLIYGIKILSVSAPVAFLFNEIDMWFLSNQQFCRGLIIALLINMSIGIWYHLKFKTFSWELFLKRNSVMITVVIVVYILLEQLRITAGDNWAGDAFKIVIQMATLIYPTSKALKNIYLITNKQHPPAFIMEKIYNFEKTGDIKALLDTDVKKESDIDLNQDVNNYQNPGA